MGDIVSEDQAGLDLARIRRLIRRRMLERAWSSKRLARESGVSPATISGLLRGETRFPQPETLGRLAVAFRRVPPLPELREMLQDAGILEREQVVVAPAELPARRR